MEDKRTGFYAVNRGTNHRKHDRKDQPAIYDTAEIAKKVLAVDREFRERMGSPTLFDWVPIPISEYNKKYLLED